MIAQIKDGGPVDVVAENVEVRLWDSQWVNVVNHADCYRDMDKEEAIATAVRMTERLMAENITKGFPPSAYNRAAVAELIGFVQDCADGRPEAEPSECRKRAIDLLARIGGSK